MNSSCHLTEPNPQLRSEVASRNTRNRARRRRLRIFPEIYCPEENLPEDLPHSRFPRGPPRRRPPWGTVFGMHWVTCRENVGVFFLGALLAMRVGPAQRTAHLYHSCPELIHVYSLGHRCSCIQSLREGCYFVQDAEGSIHANENCSSFNWGNHTNPSGLSFRKLCGWCLFQRLEEVSSFVQAQENAEILEVD